MVIDKIGNINNIPEPKRSNAASRADKTSHAADSVQISSEGKKAAEEARYVQMVHETPDVRSNRVQEIKAQMANGSYDRHLDDKVLQLVADKIATMLLKK